MQFTELVVGCLVYIYDVYPYLCYVLAIYPVYVTIYTTLSTLLALIYDSVTTKTAA